MAEFDGTSGNDTYEGTGGNDDIFGAAGNDSLNGKGGIDVVDGWSGSDILVGAAGDDILLGGMGFDDMFGGTGDDEMEGENGNDEMWGEDGDDVMFGGRGVDVMYGGADNDIMRGDDLFGSATDGGDTMYGDSGDDTILGEAGDDVIYGGADDDVIFGGAGDDELTGGAGADTFVIELGEGVDCITDFEDGVDSLDLTAFTEDGQTITEVSVGDDLEVQADGDTIAVLKGLGAGGGGGGGDAPVDDDYALEVADLTTTWSRIGAENDGTDIDANDPGTGALLTTGIFAGSNGGEFRILANGSVDFRDRDGLADGDTTSVEYETEDGTATITVTIGEGGGGGGEDAPVDDFYFATTPLSTTWDRIGAANAGEDVFANDPGAGALLTATSTPIAGSNGGEFRILANGSIDFRDQDGELDSGDTTSFDYETEDGTATVTVFIDIA